MFGLMRGELPSMGLHSIKAEGELFGERTSHDGGCTLRHFLPELLVEKTADGALHGRPSLFAHRVSGQFGEVFMRMRALLAERSSPRAVYGRVATGARDEVGTFGELFASAFVTYAEEHTPSVLPTTFPTPEAVRSGALLQTTTGFLRVGDAVQQWLGYLGIAASLDVKDLGSIGHEVRVKVPGALNPRHLTEVGTGVSRVLPLVVMNPLRKAWAGGSGVVPVRCALVRDEVAVASAASPASSRARAPARVVGEPERFDLRTERGSATGRTWMQRRWASSWSRSRTPRSDEPSRFYSRWCRPTLRRSARCGPRT